MRLLSVFALAITSTVFTILSGNASFAQATTDAESKSPTLNQTTQLNGQTKAQIRQTLESFHQINDHPFFEMRFVGNYVADTPRKVSALPTKKADSRWACSIFVSYGPDGSAIYGRNFDWQHNPAMLLHTNPTDAYASISMVDISYLGFGKNE